MFGTKDHLRAEGGDLTIDGVDVVDLADVFGTPLYVTSERRLRENARAYRKAFPEAEIYFAVKANGNLAILRILAEEGLGADVFSAGELNLVRMAGMAMDKILFNGNSKSLEELEMAVEAKVRVSADSRDELLNLSEVASEMGEVAEVAFRVNPDVSAMTHPKIATGLKTSKFGIPWQEIVEVYRTAMGLEGVKPIGLHCHIGSQILDVAPFVDAAAKMMELAGEIVDIGGEIEMMDFGGGLGIAYAPETRAPTPDELAAGILPVFLEGCKRLGISPQMVLEPGRSIVADSTLFVTGVNVVKRAHVNFVGVDGGFNLLARPMLYDAYHHAVVANKMDQEAVGKYTVVGPICESGDVLARDRDLPEVERGDVLAILDAGAYGFSMASVYNGQPRCPEVLVNGGRAELIRRGEDESAFLAGQIVPARLLR
ncbi:diaminopimelate decarboxylase [Candidatus Methanocrinis natronophilus]|uniref:Diaminopimelate decarboxylase n=1 Tax=Candidatus Methanocrinis natronophilus TaxID=3033396 RepID=A0ABT5X5T9_9EURY|nr:diaminopimelate decarboxylase [Candidatus Methanocrinis natronophilus]MDF0590059.1 diaminopimelate decarboxylase [Candidatus Methanocrinis natronophilus]